MIDEEKAVEAEIVSDDEPLGKTSPEENQEIAPEGNPNEDEFLDEHPVKLEKPVEEEPVASKPVEEEKKEEEEPPKRPKLASYEYEDDHLKAVESARIIWNKAYRKTSMIKMILSIVVLMVIIVGWIVPTIVLPNSGATPLYISLGVAGVGIVAILIFTLIQKKKDKVGIAAYFTAYYESINSYVFDGLDISALKGTYENKLTEAEVEASGLYPGLTQVGSRDSITFTYQNMDCALADMAVQKNVSRGLQTMFVGKYLRTHNTLDFPTEGKLIIYFKGNSRAIPPAAIEGQTPIEEHADYAIYGPEPLKKALTHRIKTALGEIKTDSLLVDVAIAIEPGRTYWALGYEDDLMVLPNQDAFDPYYVMEYKKQLKVFLDIALIMNQAKEN